jgi:hypothetical protein
MQFFVYLTRRDGEAVRVPKPEGIAKIGKFMEESFKSGKIAATGQLPGKSVYISLKNGKFSVTEGTFINGEDSIPGFTVINADTREEAIEWAKKLLESMGEGVLKIARLTATGTKDF